MFDPYNVDDLTRLRDSISWSRRQLEPFRIDYKEMIEQLVGSHYGNNQVCNSIINSLAAAIEINVMHLAPQLPQVSISTDFMEYRVVAQDFEIAMNREFERLGMEKLFRDVAMDAWLCMGIVKIALSHGNVIDIEGQEVDIGNLSARSISIDNWVYDMNAKKWEDCDYFGDLYQIPRHVLLNSGIYENATDENAPNVTASYDHLHDELGNERASEISAGGEHYADRTYVDYVEVWDIFLPREQKLLTLSRDDGESTRSVMPLRVVDWKGPVQGPYRMLGFSDVPENIMPLAPVKNLAELNKMINNLMMKVNSQSRRQKRITLVKPGSEDDAAQIRDATEDEMIAVNDPQAINELKIGGVDQQSHALLIWVMGEFDRAAGNLNQLGGLGASADTFGQEKLISAQSNARINRQKARMRTLMKEVYEDIAWYRWHDQFFDPRVVKKVPNSSVQVVSHFAPEDRIGNFIDYNFNISPHTTEYMDPQSKSQMLQQIIMSILIPLAPVMEQQGLALNFEAMLKKLAQLGSLPELVEIITFLTGEQVASPQAKPMEVNRPSVTTRQNIRVNRGTQDGIQQQDWQKMMAGTNGEYN